jgi:hypothetical protein
MRIYLHGDKAAKQASFPFSVNPGLSGMIAADDLPLAWKEHGEPKEFKIDFKFGAAEVDDMLGRWLIKNGMAFDRPGTAPKFDLKKMIRGWL